MSNFNDDLDSYLEKQNSSKSKTYRYSNTKSLDKVPENLSENQTYVDHIDEKKTSIFQNLLKKFGFTKKDSKEIEEISEELDEIKIKEDYIEHETEELDQEYEEIEEKKESLFQRLVSIFKKKNSEELDSEDYVEEVDESSQIYEDVDYNAKLRVLVKSLHPWLSRLSGSDLREFKHSAEYEEYTKLLKQLGMVK